MQKISTREVQTQLTEILTSKDFMASQRLRDFLYYIVNETLKGNGSDLKAYTIGVEVFKLGDNFDSRINPLVRVEAGRLRSKLEHYYILNPAAPIRISIPKGGYSVTFKRNDSPDADIADPDLYPHMESRVSTPSYKAVILVQPFKTIQGNQQTEGFSAALLNDIASALTKFKELKVINLYSDSVQGSTAAVVPQDTMLTHFILNGSVLMTGETYTIWLFLTDHSTMCNIWSEKITGSLEGNDIFTLTDLVTQIVVHRIADDFGLIHRTLLQEYSEGKSTSSIIQEASLLYYQWNTQLSIDSFKDALAQLEVTRKKEPNNALVLAMLADLYASDKQWSFGMVEDGLAKSLTLAGRALNIDPECQIGYLALALHYYLKADRKQFTSNAERAVQINPGSANVLASLAAWYGPMGNWEKSLSIIKRLIELNPASPGWYHATLSMYHYVHGEHEQALSEAKQINTPRALWDPFLRLLCNSVLEFKEEAESARQDLIDLYPDFRRNGLQIMHNSMPNSEYVEMFRRDLELSGLTFRK